MSEVQTNHQDVGTNREVYRYQDRSMMLPGIWACIITAEGGTVWEPVVNFLERDSEGYTLNPNDSQTIIHRRDEI